MIGGSADKIGFFGTTEATQPANTAKARAVLQTLGLLAASGTDTTFYKDADQTLTDGVDISVGTSSGTKIGTAVGQKIGFWNVTPVIQPTSGDQAVIGAFEAIGNTATTNASSSITNNFNTVKTLVNRLRLDLIAVGIIKGS